MQPSPIRTLFASRLLARGHENPLVSESLRVDRRLEVEKYQNRSLGKETGKERNQNQNQKEKKNPPEAKRKAMEIE